MRAVSRRDKSRRGIPGPGARWPGLSLAPGALLVLCAVLLVTGCVGRPTAQDYIAYQAVQQADGKLRTETDPQDAPITGADLVRNFERIALHHEADASRTGGEDNWRANPINRWQGQLRYALMGNAVRPADRTETADLMRRIARLTGLEIFETPDDPNFLILITSADERETYQNYLASQSPVLANTYKFWIRTPGVVCVANNLFSGRDGNQLAAGLVVIGGEVSGLLRRACLHEEIVQALGLANDHPKVRPSMFNDDGEFALMTRHDELLLRILYDPRLETGMDAEQAMPVVRRIVDEMALDGFRAAEAQTN